MRLNALRADPAINESTGRWKTDRTLTANRRESQIIAAPVGGYPAAGLVWGVLSVASERVIELPVGMLIFLSCGYRLRSFGGQEEVFHLVEKLLTWRPSDESDKHLGISPYGIVDRCIAGRTPENLVGDLLRVGRGILPARMVC